MGKQAMLYLFDRATGEPIFPIEERPVPQSDVPGEKTSPTQPFPTKPPPYDHQGVTLENLIDFTPELRAEAVKIASRYKTGPIFTPPPVSKAEGPDCRLPIVGRHELARRLVRSGNAHRLHPVVHGVADPRPAAAAEQGVLGSAVRVRQRADRRALHLGPRRERRRRRAARARARPARRPAATTNDGAVNANASPQGLPLLKPPYGRITAIDLDRGEIVWQVAHGETPDSVRNHPALKGLTIPRTGQSGAVGALVTKTLVIAGDPLATTGAGSRRAARCCARTTRRTARKSAAVYMPAQQSGTPMTYALNGKQYIVVAISGGTYSGEYVAFTLGRR